MDWYVAVLKKYAVFSGRARRKEYWIFFLISWLISFGLNFIDLAVGSYSYASEIGLFGGIYALAVLIPSLAVCVRRLHDTNRSAWWLLLWLIPIFGWIVLLVFLCFDSQASTNRYGENPKADTNSTENKTTLVI